MTRSRPRQLALLAVGLAAALLYGNFVLDWVTASPHDLWAVVSELEAPGQPGASLLRVTDVVCAVLVVALLPAVRLALPRGPWREVAVWATVLFAAGATAAAIVPMPCGPGVVCSAPHQLARQHVHDWSSQLSDLALYAGVLGAWAATRRSGPSWFHRAATWTFWVGGVLTGSLFAFFDAVDHPGWAAGATQRLHVVCISAWLVCLSVLAARAAAPTAGTAVASPASTRPHHRQEPAR